MKTATQSPIIGKTITEDKTVVTISEGTTGNKLKKQSPLNLSKFQANKDYKSAEGSLSKMLKHVAEYGKDYLQELNKKNGTCLTSEYLLNTIKDGSCSVFPSFASEKEKATAQKKGEQLGKTAPVYTFWVVLSFVSRFAEANKVKKQKETK